MSFYVVNYVYPKRLEKGDISMGTVHLTNGHHGLICRNKDCHLDRRHVLTEQMLDLQIMLSRDNILRSERGSIVRAALHALLNLKGFDSAISLGYSDSPKPSLIIPKRVWGEITHIGKPRKLVVIFSHDSRKGNAPFYSLEQWLEDNQPKDSTDTEYSKFEKLWSDASMWDMFFKSRITLEVEKLRSNAEELHEKAMRLADEASVVETQMFK